MSDTGVANGVLPYDPVEYCVLATGSAVASAFVIELNLTIFLTFKRYRGLYLWSLLVSSWGCMLHAIELILKFLVGTSWILDTCFVTVGRVMMVTGQALVLYPRLHLVLRKYNLLRGVLWMIIFDAVVLHIPTVVLTWASNSPNSDAWINFFNIMERIQLAGFCMQEFIISTIYLWATIRLLRSISYRLTRQVMWQF